MISPSFSSAKKWIIYSAFLGVFLAGLPIPVFTQQIDAQVKTMLERLPLEKQRKLKDLGEGIETYINDYDWTGESLDEKIPITIQIFLTDISVSYEDRYAGTFLITNNLDLQYYDKYWRFPYQVGERLEHNESAFHPFMGFINFYVYLIIAGEYDKYGRFLGTPFYEEAKQISDQAQFNSVFILGWKERTALIDKLLSEENKPFRMMKDFFFLGLSYVGEEDSTALKYCGQSLSLLEEILTQDPENKETLQFLQAHHIEYIHLFEEDQEVLEKLIRIDPDRAQTYRQYLEE